MKITILTLFPDIVRDYTGVSILGIASEKGLAEYNVVNIRDYAKGVHLQVDDRPFGGGPGMVLMPGPIVEAVETAHDALPAGVRTVLMSPQGRRFDQGLAAELATAPGLILVCGRYEGFDERIRTVLQPEEISIGDYVLSGGELAAMVVIDALTRQLPGVLGHELSAQEDSYADGLLDCPHYTRPEDFQGELVPEVLLSGDHERIRRWRLKQALGRTHERRPDLLKDRVMTPEEQKLLAEFLREQELSLDS